MKTVDNANYDVGLYTRLSREDVKNGKRDLSLSIENQQAMLEKYASEKGWNVYKTYIDDDFSGTTFDRPDFNVMMDDVRSGKIQCVITKDLSRLGRNYIEAGRHRELFNEYGVRYIAIHDNHDSLNNDGYDVATPIKEIVNEMYAADISRKVRATKRLMAEQGKFANSRAPYGYTKSPQDKHVLVRDENAAGTVKRIFEMFIFGKSGRYIADILNKGGIPTPNNYYYIQAKKPNPFKNHSDKWGSGTVMGIIRNPVYKGDMANGKRTVRSFKNKQILENLPDKWIVVKGTHEAIVSEADWDEAQKRVVKNHVGIRRGGSGEVSLFSGVVRCADCGTKMTYNRKVRKTYTDEYYRCGRYTNKGTDACKPHTIQQETIYNAVIADVREYAKLAYNDEQQLIDRLTKSNAQHTAKMNKQQDKFIREKEKRVEEIDMLAQALFEEKINGNVPESLFKSMAKKYADEQTTLTAEIATLKEELAESKRSANDVTQWVDKIKRCMSIEKLTRELVVELIESISVSEVYEADGNQMQNITITYRFENLKQAKRAS